jgi:DNA-binding response OmpR family regulator
MQDLRALVVEDDPDIMSLLVETLEAAGFLVTQATDGRTAVELAAADPPDLITLDLNLPRMDGIEVCRHVRESSDCYIIMVTAREEEIDRLVGLEVGADDYILKPFSPRELRARVAALFRRPRGHTLVGLGSDEEGSLGDESSFFVPGESDTTTIRCGAGLEIHTARREVRIDGDVVDVTRIEYDVLEHLASRLSRVCTREEMVLAIWSSALPHDHHLVDVHVANLRAKLRRHSSTRWIHTIRGIGYRLDPATPTESPARSQRSSMPVAEFDHDDWV